MEPTESDVTLARDAFAKALRLELARADLTVRDLSHLTRRGGAKGIAETTLGHYVRGERSPRWPEQVQIAKALDIDVVDLIASAVAAYEQMRHHPAVVQITPEPA